MIRLTQCDCRVTVKGERQYLPPEDMCEEHRACFVELHERAVRDHAAHAPPSRPRPPPRRLNTQTPRTPHGWINDTDQLPEAESSQAARQGRIA